MLEMHFINFFVSIPDMSTNCIAVISQNVICVKITTLSYKIYKLKVFTRTRTFLLYVYDDITESVFV